jgi:O-glycosyl hydrolase
MIRVNPLPEFARMILFRTSALCVIVVFAFRNPDGSIVLLVLNPATIAITFNFAWHGQSATYALQPDAVVTFHWSAKSRARL